MKNLKKVIQENIAKNIKIYTILVIIFILGLIIGIIVVNNAQDAQKAEINDYINTFINDLKNGAKIDYFKLLKTSFENNFFTVLILWFMSSTVIGIPIVYGEIGYKGFC